MSQYRCPNCGSRGAASSLAKCPNCQTIISAEQRMPFVKKLYSARKIEIQNIKCEKCGCETSFYMENSCWGDVAHCTDCSHETLDKTKYTYRQPPTITCPYCKSTDTKKISSMSKAGSLAMWGVFALGKTSKEWHCNNCKSDF